MVDQDFVFVQVLHGLAVDYAFHKFAAYGCQRNCVIVSRVASVAFLEDWGHMCQRPFSWDAPLL
ncbi:hypothetical protein DPMN_159580 [Dreissena polymorpha]|uniref:Uncharacterized protein n=1 Tax=Dreissena polymorpha TaxID=45954 RepID=A0A9D4ELP3_DREPO|nr:hypothetical protein DPMN_159580 [Dreissena polymorpha]